MNLELSQLDKRIIKAVQDDLPLIERPYKKLADDLGISEEELLLRLNILKDKGILRRMGAILYHRKAGYKYNGMGAWIVPANRIEELASLVLDYQEISHVYERVTYPDWPYNFFTMIHGQSKLEVEGIAQEISLKTGIKDYRILYSTEELKKTSMRYFFES
ncbi:siroheme decarboxylase subunit beta [Natronospora cellulosivora (SeqCode)]